MQSPNGRIRSPDYLVYSRPMSKTVLFFCGEHSDVALRKYAGICAFGQRRKWNVRFIHYRDGELSFRDALATWRPDGIISDRAAFASERATGVPTVFIDAGKDLARRIWPGVYHDPRAAARLAAAEFARSDSRAASPRGASTVAPPNCAARATSSTARPAAGSGRATSSRR